jgi:hypothetical protein
MMIKFRYILSVLLMFYHLQAFAQLAVSASQPKITGSKVVIELDMTNSFDVAIQSAKATVFLFDDQNHTIGQSTKWVIGNGKKLPSLPAGAHTTFNFVIPLTRSIATTNLQSKVTFDRLVVSDGKAVDVNKNVNIK